MSQLSLFEGSHLPRTAAREALAHADLGSALRRLEAKTMKKLMLMLGLVAAVGISTPAGLKRLIRASFILSFLLLIFSP